MTTLTALAYLADAVILGAYAFRPRRFDLANAVGGPLLLAVEMTTGAWPIVPITATFTVIGLWRCLHGSRPPRVIHQ